MRDLPDLLIASQMRTLKVINSLEPDRWDRRGINNSCALFWLFWLQPDGTTLQDQHTLLGKNSLDQSHLASIRCEDCDVFWSIDPLPAVYSQAALESGLFPLGNLAHTYYLPKKTVLCCHIRKLSKMHVSSCIAVKVHQGHACEYPRVCAKASGAGISVIP